MARQMFGDVSDPTVRVGTKQWYTVPLSILAHTALILAVVIIPLMAAEVLPGIFKGPDVTMLVARRARELTL